MNTDTALQLQQLAGSIGPALPHVRRVLRTLPQQLDALYQLPHWLGALRAARRVADDMRQQIEQLQPAPAIEQLLDGEPCSPSCAIRRRCADCDMA